MAFSHGEMYVFPTPSFLDASPFPPNVEKPNEEQKDNDQGCSDKHEIKTDNCFLKLCYWNLLIPDKDKMNVGGSDYCGPHVYIQKNMSF